MKLPRPSAKNRAFGTENLLLHKSHIAAAQHDKQPAILQRVVDQMLQHGKQRLILLRQIGEFIEYQNQPLSFLPAVDISQRLLPAGKRLQRSLPIISKDLTGKFLQIQLVITLLRRIENRLLISAEFIQQRRLAHPPAAIQDKKLKRFLLIPFLQFFQFRFPSDKHTRHLF